MVCGAADRISLLSVRARELDQNFGVSNVGNSLAALSRVSISLLGFAGAFQFELFEPVDSNQWTRRSTMRQNFG
jgi:hypothetical protein